MRGRAVWLGLLAFVLMVSAAPFVAADSPPEVVIDTPDHGSTVSGTVVISGRSGDDIRVVGVKVRVDEGDWRTARDTSPDGSWHTWALDWDTTTVPNGWHAIGAIAFDEAGQLGDYRVEVFVENHDGGSNRPPRVAIDEPPNHSTVRGTIRVKGRSGDEDVNDTVELVQVRIDHAEWQNATPTGDNGSWNSWAFSWNTSTVPDGWHAFAARAFDGALWSDNLVFEYFVDNLHDENRAPFAEIAHPRNEETVYGTVLIHGVAGDPDDRDRVEAVQVRIGEGDWMRAVDTSRDHTWRTWAFQWDTTTRDNGAVRVCARAFDGDLYSEAHCIVAKVANEHENHRPEVKILHPTMGQKVSGLVLIHGRAWDDVRVKLVEIRFGADGEWRRTTDTSPDDTWTTWAYEWNTRERDDGCLKIFARAYDGSLFSELAYVEVCVDNENDRPFAKILHPKDGETVHGLVLVHGVAGDDHGVKYVEVRIDDGPWDEATNTGRDRRWGTWAYEWNTGRYENGKHRVCARAFDGERYSEPHCIVVIVHNERDGGGGILGAPEALGSAGPALTLGLFGLLGVAMLMWLRSHRFLR